MRDHTCREDDGEGDAAAYGDAERGGDGRARLLDVLPGEVVGDQAGGGDAERVENVPAGVL